MYINTNGPNNSNASDASSARRSGAASDLKINRDASGQQEATNHSSNDRVLFSDEAKVLKSLEQGLDSSMDVDMERVSALRQSISDGSYQVDASSIASKLLDTTMGY